MITFQPRLEADQPVRRRRPIETRKVALAPVRRKLPDRIDILKPGIDSPAQRSPNLFALAEPHDVEISDVERVSNTR